MRARFQAACRPLGQSVSRTSGHSELYICHSIVVVKNGLTTEGHTTEGRIRKGHYYLCQRTPFSRKMGIFFWLEKSQHMALIGQKGIFFIQRQITLCAVLVEKASKFYTCTFSLDFNWTCINKLHQ